MSPIGTSHLLLSRTSAPKVEVEAVARKGRDGQADELGLELTVIPYLVPPRRLSSFGDQIPATPVPLVCSWLGYARWRTRKSDLYGQPQAVDVDFLCPTSAAPDGQPVPSVVVKLPFRVHRPVREEAEDGDARDVWLLPQPAAVVVVL